MSSPKQASNVAFADALERARQIAAKLGHSSSSGNAADVPASSAMKRSQLSAGTDQTTSDEPSSKKVAQGDSTEVISPQLATLKAKQVAKQINEQLGIFKSNTGRSECSEDVRVDSNAVGQGLYSSGIGPGRQSEIIKRLSDQYGVKIAFVDDPTGASKEKLVRITGDSDKVARTQQVIKQLTSSDSGSLQGVYGEYGNRTSDSAVIESQFNVPAEKAGIVIGKGGESIKEINRRSGAYVEIDRAQNQKTPSTPGSFKVFNIRGTKEQIMQAQHMIYDKCVNSHGGAPNMVPPPGHPALLQPSQSSTSYPIKSSLMAPPMQSYGQQPVMGVPPMDMNSAYPSSTFYGGPQSMDMYGGSGPGGWPPVSMQPGYGMQPNPWTTYAADPWQQFPSGNATSDMMTSGAAAMMDFSKACGGSDWPGMYNTPAANYGSPHQPLPQGGDANPPSSALPGTVSATPQAVSAPPVTNPQTGQPDYSLAWAEYYRSIGMHAQADYIISQAAQSNLIPSGSAGGDPSGGNQSKSDAAQQDPRLQQATGDKDEGVASNWPGSDSFPSAPYLGGYGASGQPAPMGYPASLPSAGQPDSMPSVHPPPLLGQQQQQQGAPMHHQMGAPPQWHPGN